MATQRQSPPASLFKLRCVAKFPRMRALYWDGDVLYASRGYELLRAKVDGTNPAWQSVGRYQPEWWRMISSVSRLSSRLFRDGFHALNVIPSKHLVAAVPKAIITLAPGSTEFQMTQQNIAWYAAAAHCIHRRWTSLLGRVFRQPATCRSAHLCLDRSWSKLVCRLHVS